MKESSDERGRQLFMPAGTDNLPASLFLAIALKVWQSSGIDIGVGGEGIGLFRPRTKDILHLFRERRKPHERTPEGLMQYLEGQGDSVSRLIAPIGHIITQLSLLLTYLLSPHDPNPKPYKP